MPEILLTETSGQSYNVSTIVKYNSTYNTTMGNILVSATIKL